MKILWGFFSLVTSLGTKAFYKSDSRDPSPPLLSRSSPSNSIWTAVPFNGLYSTAGFGGSTNPFGSGNAYVGNIGRPYGSNIVEVSSSDVSQYKYVAKFGPSTDGWKVVIWNKAGPDGRIDGWYNNACHTFTLTAGEVRYIAFASNSQGGWTAANTTVIPADQYGGYASTWGEFDFGSTPNNDWSGFDVSAIQAQNANLEVQGMKICSLHNEYLCSYVTRGATVVHNAYASSEADAGGIGGNLPPGPVRLVVNIDYDEQIMHGFAGC